MKNTSVTIKLGEAIREMRKNKNISQEELAFQCGLHRTYIGSIERGERNVAIENIVKIASVLNTDAAQLLKKAKL